ncbi:MAG: FAD-dependent oxidoreductase [Elusimicrobiaceae bacterium]
MKTIIVGGVAGGASAAARLRRLNEKAEIVIFERTAHVSFANCGLPYYIGGTIRERENLLMLTPQDLKMRFNLDVRVKSEVTALDLKNKTVTVKNHETGRLYSESYDKLILAPGAKPFLPPVPGMDSENIFTVRTLDDADRIKEFIRAAKPSRAVVIGAGYIGIEMAESLSEAGVKVSIIEKTGQILAPLDPEMTAEPEAQLLEHGIALYKNAEPEQIYKSGGQLVFKLKDGREIAVDFAICAIGVRPETALAKAAGLEIGESGGIHVDEHMRTSDPDIYAVGDAVETAGSVPGGKGVIPLAGPANRQGRVAADNIAGRNSVYKAALGTSIVKVFNLAAAATGASEKTLKKNGTPYLKTYVHGMHHASYYPGALPLTIKLMFAPETGKVLGAQAVGAEGADKRIDVIASVMKLGGTVYDLRDLELCYAPPFGSAKDPVNMAGMAAENILSGLVKPAYADDIEALSDAAFILDVRTQDEYIMGAVPGAVNIPVDELRSRLPEIPKNRPVIAYCAKGFRSYLASRILAQNGYDVSSLSGGYALYKHAAPVSEGKEKTEVFKEACARAVKTEIDARGLQCPGPIMKLAKTVKTLADGELLDILVTDPGFKRDIAAWCHATGNTPLSVTEENNVIRACLRKGKTAPQASAEYLTPADGLRPDKRTIVVFSNDLDKALASFIIANGAAALGAEVTMFFTFWGLNILRKDQYVPVKKGFMDRMFGLMMPRGTNHLKLSKMNFGGLGTLMMKSVMKRKNVETLSAMLEEARKQGVKMIACTMAMDIMGIREEELIDGVEKAGVATYLAQARDANTNLFI